MNISARTIELLSPARTADIGIEAIRAGADAVYIGAQSFSARADAGNYIARLVNYAHLYGAKIYVALNTILYDQELEAAHKLILELAQVGVDALITQDTALLQMDLPLPLHASTQMDNRTPEQVQFLSQSGFSRAILARELSTEEIRDIHKAVPQTELEVFVHGALCVSLSGRCYASQYCFHRSANRGECAQFCRLAFDLEDDQGHKILRDKHLLSLRDMNRSQSLEELMDAGVCSFKIEGRLKDSAYVKNITAYYRSLIDTIINRRPEYHRVSFGTSHPDFVPNPLKSFNRGFTDYFLHGRTSDIFSFNTPKAIGEPVGCVKEIHGSTIKVAGLASFSNGDGICYLDTDGKLQGFRINRVENNVLHLPAAPQGLLLRTPLYRNHDAAFERQLSHPMPERTLGTDILLEETPQGFRLTLTDESGQNASLLFDDEKQPANKPQKNRQEAELARLGNTCLQCRNVEIRTSQDYFIPASHLSDWRRQVVKSLLELKQRAQTNLPPHDHPAVPCNLDYTYNISNHLARQFYEQCGAKETAPAFELQQPAEARLMTCRHCLRYALQACPRNHPSSELSEPLFLVLPDGRRFRLHFNCRLCQMEIYEAH